jgi:hypothetical protein
MYFMEIKVRALGRIFHVLWNVFLFYIVENIILELIYQDDF